MGKPIDFDDELFFKQLDELKVLAHQETDQIKQKVSEIVTTYKPC